MSSSTLPEAISRPRPTTMSSVAVTAISLIRCDETKTVRPSAASAFNRLRIQRMPSGSRPFTGSSSSSVPGSPSSADAMPEPLAHAEREAPGPLAGDLVQPDQPEHLVDPRLLDAVRRCHGEQVVARRPSGVHGTGLQQRAHFPQRRRKIDVCLAVDAAAAGIGRSSPSSSRIVVDFPAPFGPRKPVTTPGRTTKLRSSTAVFPPYRLVRPSASIMPSTVATPHVELRPPPWIS